MIGRFLFGALAGGITVAAALVVGAIFVPPQGALSRSEVAVPANPPPPAGTPDVAEDAATAGDDAATASVPETGAAESPDAEPAEISPEAEVDVGASDTPEAATEATAGEGETAQSDGADPVPPLTEAGMEGEQQTDTSTAEGETTDPDLAAAPPPETAMAEPVVVDLPPPVRFDPPAPAQPAPAQEPMPTLPAPDDGGNQVATAQQPATLPATDPPDSLPVIESSSDLPPAPDPEGGEDGNSAAEGATSESPPAPAQPDDDRPITRFAAAFQNPEAKPVLAVVLIDTGEPDLDRAELVALPFQVSFALDPRNPAAAEYAAVYRAAGREVIMLATGIAEDAAAADVERAFRSMNEQLPQAVAVMDLGRAAFQNDRALSAVVVPVIGAQGRGLLTWEKRVNIADQVARREDIASAVIFRDLAMGGGDRAAAKRTLDRAAFKAGKDGKVVVAGIVSTELVAALLEWSVEGRAGAVALGPVTAAMTVE